MFRTHLSKHLSYKLAATRSAACFAALLTITGPALADSPYAAATDDELTAAAAGWDELSRDERRALLTEVRGRMAESSTAVPMLRIQRQRRYGRVIRQPDGSMLHIEQRERSVEYRPMPEDAAGAPFGIGFENRLGVPASNDPGRPSSPSAPAIPVENAPPG